jgi:hypothetical protein
MRIGAHRGVRSQQSAEFVYHFNGIIAQILDVQRLLRLFAHCHSILPFFITQLESVNLISLDPLPPPTCVS